MAAKHGAGALDAALPEAGLVIGAEGEERRRRREAERGGAAPALGAGDAEARPVAHVHVELAGRPLPLLLLEPPRVGAGAGAVICGDERRVKWIDMTVVPRKRNSDRGDSGPGIVPGAGWTWTAGAAFWWWCAAAAFLETPPVGLVAAPAPACAFC